MFYQGRIDEGPCGYDVQDDRRSVYLGVVEQMTQIMRVSGGGTSCGGIDYF